MFDSFDEPLNPFGPLPGILIEQPYQPGSTGGTSEPVSTQPVTRTPTSPTPTTPFIPAPTAPAVPSTPTSPPPATFPTAPPPAAFLPPGGILVDPVVMDAPVLTVSQPVAQPTDTSGNTPAGATTGTTSTTSTTSASPTTGGTSTTGTTGTTGTPDPINRLIDLISAEYAGAGVNTGPSSAGMVTSPIDVPIDGTGTPSSSGVNWKVLIVLALLGTAGYLAYRAYKHRKAA